MNDVERALTVLLVERAERIAPRRGHRDDTLRRARRRRVTNAVVAGVASVAVVAGGFGVVRTLDSSSDSSPDVRVAAPMTSGQTTATTGDYGFWSKTGPEYPWVAKGRFRDRHWQLRAALITPGESLTRLTFRIDDHLLLGGVGASTGFEEIDDGLYVMHHDLAFVFDHEVAGVFGAATPEAHTVEAVVDGITSPIEAHVFEGYDAKTGIQADYWAAFVPADSGGRIVVRDDEGHEIASAVIPMRPRP